MNINEGFIFVPGGSYNMGEQKKLVTIKPFYLAKFPVTNKLYRKFLEATRHKEPYLWDNKKYNKNKQPVVGVSWDDTVVYCQWLTENSKEGYQFRLPTEEEWEWAAGRGEREYPWGDEQPDHNRANYDNKIGYPTPVGSYPAGATHDGLMDMAGNVWEWTASVHETGEPGRVIKGGACYNTSGYLRCSARLRIRRSYDWNLDGFRVACVPHGDLEV